MLFGDNGSLLRFPIGGPSGPAILGEGNAIPGTSSGYTVSGIVSPGGVVSFYGAGLGPAIGVGARLDSSGKVATELAGTQLLIGGVPAPLLYASENQINAVVPFGVSSEPVATAQVRSAAGTSELVALHVVAADPAIPAYPDPLVNGVYQSLILNQDGSINSRSNPAPRGSIITFWATGAGRFRTDLVDGSIVQPPLPEPALPVSVVLRQYPNPLSADILYAGAAPGMVAGIIQVNARIPANAAPGDQALELQAGDFRYGGTLTVK